jgi:hypothetical protein
VKDATSSMAYVQCITHKGVKQLQTGPQVGMKARKCTSCSGCIECRQPQPLVIPEGTGGTGCSAEVAAVAEALRAVSISKVIIISRASTRGGRSRVEGGAGTSGDDGDSSTSGPGTAASLSTAPSNPALVECGVCHRRPGDPGVPATLKLCGGCHITRYCSIECQRKDWKLGHKAVCLTIQEMKKVQDAKIG